MSEPMTFQKKSRRERYIVRDDVSSGTKKDAELIGPLIKHKNNAEPKNKLGPASCWCGRQDLNLHVEDTSS